MEELTDALNQAIKDQMENGKTTLIEAMINQELGEPFRRDAMKKPVQVAGIDKDDMSPQKVLMADAADASPRGRSTCACTSPAPAANNRLSSEGSDPRVVRGRWRRAVPRIAGSSLSATSVGARRAGHRGRSDGAGSRSTIPPHRR